MSKPGIFHMSPERLGVQIEAELGEMRRVVAELEALHMEYCDDTPPLRDVVGGWAELFQTQTYTEFYYSLVRIMQYKVIVRVVTAVLISLTTIGCIEYSLDDPGIIADVDISRVTVTPDTVAVGDSLLVEVVFNRGDGKKLNITWLMPETETTPLIIRTDTHELDWSADVEPGIYIGIVTVDDEMTIDGAVSQQYPFIVVSRE